MVRTPVSLPIVVRDEGSGSGSCVVPAETAEAAVVAGVGAVTGGGGGEEINVAVNRLEVP